MKKLIFLIAVSAAAQTAYYPTAISSFANLGLAVNGVQTSLVMPINQTATSFIVQNSTGIVPNFLMTFSGNGEIVLVCQVSGTVVTVGWHSCPGVDGRGFNGTVAASHVVSEDVQGNPVAWYHNADAIEIIALETELGINLGNITKTTIGLPNVLNVAQVADPGANGIPFRTGLGTSRLAIATDIASLFGSCSGIEYLGYDGNCHSPLSLPNGTQNQLLTIVPNTGNNTTYAFNDPPTVQASKYIFNQTPGGTLSAGTNNILFAPVPNGMNGNDVNHYVYVSGGTGTPQVCLINGGSGVSGQVSGNITVSCPSGTSISGAWTVQSVLGGIPEAIQYLATNYGFGQITLDKGFITAYGPAYIPQAEYFYQVGAGAIGFRYRISGQGKFVSQIRLAASAAESGPDVVGFPLTAAGVIVCTMSEANSIIGPEIDNLSIWGVEPDSTNVATYTQWPWGINIFGGMGSQVHDVSIFGWNGVSLVLSEGSRVEKSYFSTFGTGIYADGNADSMYFEDDRWWIYGMTINQQTAFLTATNTGIIGISLGRNDDFHITHCFFINPVAINFFKSSAYIPAGIPSGLVDDSHFDGLGQVLMSDGAVVFQGGTEGVNTATWLQLTGGAVYIQGMLIDANYCTQPAIRANFASASPLGGQRLEIIGNTISQLGCNIGIIDVNDGGTQPAAVRIVGNTFVRPSGIAYTTAMIGDFTTNAGSVVLVTGNTAENTGVNQDYFTQVLTDGFKTVKNNTLLNTQISLGFSPPYLGEYETDQIKWTQPIQNQNYGGSVSSTGTNVTIAIPQSGLPTESYAQAFTISGTGSIQNLTVPQGITGMTIYTVAAGAWTTVSGGNIASIITAVPNTEYIWSLINGTWWIK